MMKVVDTGDGYVVVERSDGRRLLVGDPGAGAPEGIYEVSRLLGTGLWALDDVYRPEDFTPEELAELAALIGREPDELAAAMRRAYEWRG